MANTKRNINPEQGKRLKQLLTDYKLTQRKLSEEVGISQQYISEIINGRAHLSPGFAEDISCIPLFKNENLLEKWLLCQSDYKSTSEMLIEQNQKLNFYINDSVSLVFLALKLNGFTVRIKYGNEELDLSDSSITNKLHQCNFEIYDKDICRVATMSLSQLEIFSKEATGLFSVIFESYLLYGDPHTIKHL